jgi:hypothetical protein
VPVESNRAATVTLHIYSQSVTLATGQISIADGLMDRIVGDPTITVTSSAGQDYHYEGYVISDIAASGDGFSFHIEFPNADEWEMHYFGAEIIVTVSLTLRCDDITEDTQMVESSTVLHYCDLATGRDWIASGGDCVVCYEVCEMVATPIPTSPEEHLRGLSGSPDVHIVPVAKFGRSVVLFAESFGTEGALSYEWRAVQGTLTEPDAAGVIWELPKEAGPHLIQVAVKDRNTAAVATMRWRHRA